MDEEEAKMKTLIIILITLLSFTVQADEVALTFDDLPCAQGMKASVELEINQNILSALKNYKAPAIGFVNEGKLYKNGETDAKIDILKLWTQNGLTLGNHTYSHIALSNSQLKDFEADVIKGSLVSKKLMQQAGLSYRYFRHPYLHTGTSKDTKNELEVFLNKEGYIVAPVTIDTDDWKFNQLLLKNPGDIDQIIAEYLAHTKTKFEFYKEASQKIFGRNIKHIWLLHVNLINAYAMDDLLKLAKDLDYDFITLDQALEDKVYLEPDSYYKDFGVSWLYRWDYTRGKVVDWKRDPEPEIDDNGNAKKIK